MKKREKREQRRKIAVMILIPALVAAILLFAADRLQEGSSADGAGHRTPAGSAVSGRNSKEEAVSGQEKEAEPSEAAQHSPEGAAAAQQAEGISSKIPEIPEAERTGPLQDLAFTDGSGNARGRSIPVQIDASILGGESGTKCWAVFLPAEMAEHPHLVFSKFTGVTLEPLAEEDRLSGGRRAPQSSEEGAGAGSGGAAPAGPVAYASGEEAEGLSDGSAFLVRMEGADGTAQEETLYVFSCTGTATMYLDTESGSMANVDGDETKQTAEGAQFLVRTPDGAVDSSGACTVRGRGNSTWSLPKRPYNVNLSEKQSVLGMNVCKKLCLLSNAYDHTNLLDRISAQIALSLNMRDTPQGEFVNLYLNGQYNGLYYLSQRVRTGGSVHIKKLDNRILEANGQEQSPDTSGTESSGEDTSLEEASGTEAAGEQSPVPEASGTETAGSGSSGTGGQTQSSGTSLRLPKRIALHEEGEKLKKYAYDWPNEPADNTGGYLLQQHEGYNGPDCWFSTRHRRFRIMSPACPTTGQVEYLQDYMLAAERAVYSEDGRDPDSGKPYTAFLDMNSWQDMFLLEEYFVEWDGERWSFFITKDRNDPLLYCGPMWDFDHSAGTMLYGIYPETAVSTLMFRDTRHGWLHQLLSHGEFADALHRRWVERFSPAVHRFLDERLEAEISAIESASYMNNIRRANDVDFREDTDALRSWLTRRAAFLDDYAADAEAWCAVDFQFPWGSLTHYVKEGETLGFLPLPEYGETQVPSQVRKHEIIAWQDEDGREVTADVVIDTGRVFTPVYR